MNTRRAEKRRREAETPRPVPAGTRPVTMDQLRSVLTDSEIETMTLPLAPLPFIWTSDRMLHLLFSMTRLKPAGQFKFVRIYYIQKELNKRLKMHVPRIELWKFMNSLWDIKLADEIENEAPTENREEEEYVFELPDMECLTWLMDKAAELMLAELKRRRSSTSSGQGQRANIIFNSRRSAMRAELNRSGPSTSSGQSQRATINPNSRRSAMLFDENQSGPSTSSGQIQRATNSGVSPLRRRECSVMVERMDSMLTAEQKEKLLKYKTDRSMTTLEDTISNFHIDAKKK